MKGRAFVFTGVNAPFEQIEYPLPEVEPGGILVRLTMANICGSDLHGWHGETPREPPTIMGHEMTGQVAKLGSQVRTDAAGQPLSSEDAPRSDLIAQPVVGGKAHRGMKMFASGDDDHTKLLAWLRGAKLDSCETDN